MGYPQFVRIQLVNRSGRDLVINNLYHHWGRLYEYPDKDNVVNENTVNNKTVSNGSTFSFASCGKEGAAAGTEGEFNLFDGSESVMKIYWDCPWSGSNKFSTYYVKAGWFPSVSPWNTDGPLDTVTVTIFKA